MTCVERLFALEQFGIKLGLDAMRALLAALGRPERALALLSTSPAPTARARSRAMVERGAARAPDPHRPLHLAAPRPRSKSASPSTASPSTPATFDAALGRVFAGVDACVAERRAGRPPTFFEVTDRRCVRDLRRGARRRRRHRGRPRRPLRRDQRHHARRSRRSPRIDVRPRAPPGHTLAAIAVREGRHRSNPACRWWSAMAPTTPAVIDAVARRTAARRGLVPDGTTRSRRPSRRATSACSAHAAGGRTARSAWHWPARTRLATPLVAVRVLETLERRDRACASAPRPSPRRCAEVRLAGPARVAAHPASGARVLIDAAHNPAGARALAAVPASDDRQRAVTLVTSVMARQGRRLACSARCCPGRGRVIVTAATATAREQAGGARGACAALGRTRPGVDVEVDPGRRTAARSRCALPAIRSLVAGSIYLVGPLRAALLERGGLRSLRDILRESSARRPSATA